jgi:hypothetical protein
METLVRSTLDEMADHRAALTNAVCQLGEATFDALLQDKQHRLNLFVIGGCCGHKDGNAFQGGYKAMHDVWPMLDALPPILLVNKDNAATINLGQSSDSNAVLRAEKSSESGRPKFLNLAGTLYNHKDDKKGHQDVHRWFMGKVKRDAGIKDSASTFPDTSNNRFQSFGNGATEVFPLRQEYKNLMEFLCDKKEKPGFNHMEQNVYDGLNDDATMTELAVMLLYSQAISLPYMAHV